MDIRGFLTRKRKADELDDDCSSSQQSECSNTMPQWEHSDDSMQSDSDTSASDSQDDGSFRIAEICTAQLKKPPGPSDLSQNKDCMPVQPKLSAFPQKKFGQKWRAFNPNWYSIFPWIEYSQSEDAVYCFACRHFPQTTKNVTVFLKNGFQNWKRSTGKDGSLTLHNNSESHKASHTAWCDFKMHTKEGRTIQNLINEDHSKLVKENRHYIKTIAEILRLTATQCIAQRGHREGEQSVNQGNFLEILNLIAMRDDIVKKKLSGARNAKYTHHSIQDQLLNIMARLVRQQITEEVAAAGAFSIQVDESKDISKIEQISLVVRYVHGGKIHEEFLGFQQAKGLDATSLTRIILQTLADNSIDINACIAQCYDGASVMSGEAAGVQAKFREEVPKAIYIHCYSHRLNLVVVDCVKNIQMAAEFFSLLQTLYNFISGSAVHAFFIEIQKEIMPAKVPVELKRLSDTRWTCQYAACNSVHKTLPAIMETLHHYVGERGNAERTIQAKALVHIITSTFAINLVMFELILKKTSIVAKCLQSSDLQLSCAVQLVASLQEELSEARRDSESESGLWSTVWTEAQKLIQDNGLPQAQPIERARIWRRPVSHQDHITMSTTGQRHVLQSKDDFRKHLFLPALDRIIGELDRRFDDKNCEILKAVAALTPGRKDFLQEENVLPMAHHYGLNVRDLSAELYATKRLLERNPDEDINSMHALSHYLMPYRDAFFELYRLLIIALTLPVTSAGCERSFSKLRMIKTYLRNRMANERLSNLAVLSINEGRTQDLDMDSVVDIFAKLHSNRRITLL